MSRRRKNRSLARDIKPDPIYDDITVARFINKLTLHGKKEKARTVFYNSLKKIKEMESSKDPITVFKKAIENCKPSMEVRSRRVGGATYQVPVDVRPGRKVTLAMRWLVLHSRSRKGRPMDENLAKELVEAYNNRGNAVKKKEEVHRMAESNRAFSHYNW
ncbi:MAG: 30S ribosomal protein S7 [Bdellovibrionaceae bacterium]|nr:30S ribosomal protein S7 [Pseudobdellovibrionaceae bacterium]